MNEKVYMHAVSSSSVSVDDQVCTFFSIVKEGSILSLRNQGITESDGFAGLDYISLCDYEKRFLHAPDNIYYNAFNSYIRCGISFAFDKESLDVIIPQYIEILNKSAKRFKIIRELGYCRDRFSDLKDEVQVKDRISLDALSYVTFPTKVYFEDTILLSKDKKIDLLKNKVDELKQILTYYDYNVDIYDIDTQIKMDEEGIYKLIYKK